MCVGGRRGCVFVGNVVGFTTDIVTESAYVCKCQRWPVHARVCSRDLGESVIDLSMKLNNRY